MTETPQPPDGAKPVPGYYPDGSGTSRYWDGNAWTEQTQVFTPAPSGHAGKKGNRPWFKKKRIVIPGVLVLLLIIGGIAGGSEEEKSDTTTDASSAKNSAPDADNDGVPDAKDAFASDPKESKDANANGVGDNADAQALKDAKAAEDAAAAAAEKAAKDKAEKAAEDKRRKAAKAAAAKKQAKIDNAPFASERDLALVFKDPDSYVGDVFKIWGNVTQFDAATGTDTFLANTANRNTTSYGYFDGENAAFQGDEDALSKLVEDDTFIATVKVAGSLSYDTQIGGSTTVPQFEVLKIARQ